MPARVVVAVVALAISLAAASEQPAAAHFCATPVYAEPGRTSTIAVAVAAEDSVAVEVAISAPAGFRLADPPQTDGWSGSVDGRTARFTGGSIQPRSCEYFRLRGVAARRGNLVFPITVTDRSGQVRTYRTVNDGGEYSAQLVYVRAVPKAGGAEGGLAGSVSIPLLLAGAALVLSGGVAIWRKRLRLTRRLLLAGGVGLVAVSFVFGGGGAGRPDVRLAVTTPRTGATVPAGQPVGVQVTVDGPLASSAADRSGGHLHVFVDGAVQFMRYATSADVTFVPGRHTVTVEYVDARHLSYDPPIERSVEITAR